MLTRSRGDIERSRDDIEQWTDSRKYFEQFTETLSNEQNRPAHPSELNATINYRLYEKLYSIIATLVVALFIFSRNPETPRTSQKPTIFFIFVPPDR
jgi:hypothetical protein